jgi:hypothetical protein
MNTRFLSPLIVATALRVAGADVIQTRETVYATRIRTTAFAQQSEVVACPLHHPQIKFLVPDGARVEKGDRIAEFDEQDALRRLREEELQRETIEAELARKLIEIRNKDMKLRDDLQALLDRRSVLEARQAKLLALPEEARVAVAASRLRVAQLEQAAAAEDVRRDRERLNRGLIAAVTLDEGLSVLRERDARLAHASNHLAYASLPASSGAVRRVELEIANLDLEIGKTRHELAESAQISDIQAKGAAARKEIVETRIAELRDDVKSLKVFAPLAGHVMYLRQFRAMFLGSGMKMWKNFNFLRIPDPATIAFKGMILESDRKYFQVGDPARLHVVGVADPARGESAAVVLPGRIASISKLSRDQAEREEEEWGGPGELGVMVHDVTVVPDERPPWLRVGTHAEAELTATRPRAGPAIPLALVKAQDGDFYLSLDGVYRKARGEPVNGLFFLEDAALEGREVGLHGVFPSAHAAEPDRARRLRVTGELLPANTADVTVKRILSWQKVAWLVEEDAEVRKGDVVARLNAKETDEEISRSESRLKEAESARRSLEEELALRRRANRFRLARQSNDVEIARLDRDAALEAREWPAIFDGDLERRLAASRLSALTARRARAERNPALLSAREREDLERDIRRQVLRKEQADIRLAVLQAGPRPAERLRAETAFAEQALKLATLEKETQTDEFRMVRQLNQSRNHESRARQHLDSRREWKANLTLVAPRDGIVRFSKIWNSGVLSKVNVGSMITHAFVPLRIADAAEMYVRAELPETYYTRVATGMPVTVRIPSLSDASLDGKVSEVEFLFEDKRRKDTKIGLYSSHEALGETVFYARVNVPEQKGVKLKPGAVAEVWFPFQP